MRQPPSAERPPGAAVREMQARLLAALRDPDGFAEALDQKLFIEPPAGSIARRWAIYGNAYIVRLVEAIENDFPAISRIMGPEPFGALCRRFVQACPPCSHDIGRAGERLAEYLPGDPVTASLPFLPDLARFEWALAESIGAPDFDALAWSELAATPVEEIADLPLRLGPGTFVIESRWPLGPLWLAKDTAGSEIDIPLEGHPSVILVSRQGLQPRWRTIDPDERTIVEGASHGATAASLLQSGAFGENGAASRRLVLALRRVVSYGALCRLSLSGVAKSAPHSKEIP